MPGSVLNGPCPGCLQRVASFLPFEPGAQPRFVYRKVKNPRTPDQSAKEGHHVSHTGKDNLIHCFRFALAGIGVEIGPLPIWAQNEHTRFRYWIGWRNSCLGHQIRPMDTAGPQIQDLGIMIIVRDCSHQIRKCLENSSTTNRHQLTRIYPTNIFRKFKSRQARKLISKWREPMTRRRQRERFVTSFVNGERWLGLKCWIQRALNQRFEFGPMDADAACSEDASRLFRRRRQGRC